MSGTPGILIVGGYGTFGGRIVKLLESDDRLTLIVAGRSLARAEAYCRARQGAKASLLPAVFDRDGDAHAQIAALRPKIVVDASGPFQAYGARPYRLVEACIACGIDYLDLADGADFVAGIAAFDDRARAAGVFVLSGVSSFPVLTAAAVRRLAEGMGRVDTIRGGIAPSPYAGVGENVIRAIAGYAGKKVPLRRDGAPASGYPFTEHMRFTIAPPGHVPLKSTLFSLVDVPDLRALAELWPQARTVWMGAGPVPEMLHRALTGFAWLARLGLVRSLSPLAPLVHFCSNRLRWGEHRGGMFVAVEGTDTEGQAVARSWHLLAEGDDGPLIPSMAVQAVLCRVLAGQPPRPGARTAASDLELADYESLFAGRRLFTGTRDDRLPETTPLYARLLGSAWDRLPPQIRALHDGASSAAGRAVVERGGNPLARLAAALIGFPRAQADVPVTVRFASDGAAEIWTRAFGGQRFSSRQFEGSGKSERLLCERFGPLTFDIALTASQTRLSLVLRGWRFLGLRLPMWLCPRSEAFEAVEDGRFRFHVAVSHPLVGLIVRYRGWLVPEGAAGIEAADATASVPGE